MTGKKIHYRRNHCTISSCLVFHFRQPFLEKVFRIPIRLSLKVGEVFVEQGVNTLTNLKLEFCVYFTIYIQPFQYFLQKFQGVKNKHANFPGAMKDLKISRRFESEFDSSTLLVILDINISQGCTVWLNLPGRHKKNEIFQGVPD